MVHYTFHTKKMKLFPTWISCFLSDFRSCDNTLRQSEKNNSKTVKSQRVKEGNTGNVHVTKLKWISKTGGI